MDSRASANGSSGVGRGRMARARCCWGVYQLPSLGTRPLHPRGHTRSPQADTLPLSMPKLTAPGAAPWPPVGSQWFPRGHRMRTKSIVLPQVPGCCTHTLGSAGPLTPLDTTKEIGEAAVQRARLRENRQAEAQRGREDPR